MGRLVKIVDRITFDQLVGYGKQQGVPLVADMPWSFKYKGKPVTHENDNCYLVATFKDFEKFERGDMLCTGADRKLYIAKGAEADFLGYEVRDV